jgi:predicted deacylase
VALGVRAPANELNGLEIVRRIMSDTDPSTLAGTLVVVCRA